MKKSKITKLLAGTLLMVSVLALNPIAASAEWKQDNNGWWYTEGNSWARGWRTIDGSLYYFKANGYMVNNAGNMFFDQEDGLNSSGQFANVTISGDWAFCRSTGKIVAYLGSQSIINIPDKIDNVAVTGIGAYAFSSTKITNVTIPSTVSDIGDCAFSGCINLANITIPNSVKSIDDHAFINCRSLKNVTIPGSVISMGNSVFSGCYSLTNATVENGVTFLGNDTFSDCFKLENVSLPNNLTIIGETTFQGCISLRNLVIPSGVTSIGKNAFNYCTNLTSLTLPDGVTTICAGAFKDCISLTSITIPNSVQTIETRINGPRNIITEANPFEGCSNVKVYVKSEATKQLLVGSGVSANQIIVAS
ncbi:leucine-rich repeat domain-containing protein [Clostridium sp. BL-8]|uniref:leucine-rich repeat domain-containing protein n=1 Tax=Clostridium sp. BL-8 TaxID=349938 RepID=UPI00098C4821|nr:leucine-rich repeat domain-containing protein [Clostridium sp. BL-8]OOM80576.1 hypothetical protein CLOBL_08690 [Clostridium sp. BL-8]